MLFVLCETLWQSALVISKYKELYGILQDIRTSTYQICRTKEKINRTATFHKWICNLTPEVRDILKILWKSGEIALSTTFCYLLLDFHVKTGTRFSFRDKRFKIRDYEVEITRVDYSLRLVCLLWHYGQLVGEESWLLWFCMTCEVCVVRRNLFTCILPRGACGSP